MMSTHMSQISIPGFPRMFPADLSKIIFSPSRALTTLSAYSLTLGTFGLATRPNTGPSPMLLARLFMTKSNRAGSAHARKFDLDSRLNGISISSPFRSYIWPPASMRRR